MFSDKLVAEYLQLRENAKITELGKKYEFQNVIPEYK